MVAGLKAVPKGGTGGGLVEASTLYQSGLSQAVELIPLSSTARSIYPKPSLPVKCWDALQRTTALTRLLGRVDCVLLYISGALSLLEKGAMSVMARLAGRGVVLRFTGGGLPDECERQPLLKRWLHTVLSAAHVVVVQGDFWREYFNRYAPARDKIVVIPNGIAIPSELPQRPAATAPRIGFIGWIERTKGVYELFDAFCQLRQRVPSAQLVFGGGGAELEPLRSRVAALSLQGSVQFLGWVPHERMYPLLRSFDVFALPSHFEGLPNAMLEAMAAELPCVVTRVGAIPDVVRDGDNGFVLDVGAVAQLRDRLADLLTDPARARRMGALSRRIMQERCDIEIVWQRYADVLARAAHAAGRGQR
jgi:glycosyltransferase involved in cell wall biosynthesis